MEDAGGHLAGRPTQTRAAITEAVDLHQASSIAICSASSGDLIVKDVVYRTVMLDLEPHTVLCMQLLLRGLSNLVCLFHLTDEAPLYVFLVHCSPLSPHGAGRGNPLCTRTPHFETDMAA
jgi:hypothetical protein